MAASTPPEGQDRLGDLLANWDRFGHDDSDLDPLSRTAVVHYQFEAIDPFTDGNGRTGPILKLLFLVAQGLLLDQPVLSLSRAIIHWRTESYRLLNVVKRDDAWEPSVLYMLDAVHDTAGWTTKQKPRTPASGRSTRSVDGRKTEDVAQQLNEIGSGPQMNGTGSSLAAVQSYFYQLGAVALTIFVVSVARPVLVPLALAILLAFVLSPVVSWGQRRGLGRIASTLSTVLIAFAGAAALAFVITTQIAALARELPQHQSEIEAKLERLRGSDGPFSRLATMVQELAKPRRPAGESAPNPPVRVQIEPETHLAETLEPIVTLLEPVATGALVVVLMVFVLLGREDLRSRLLATVGQSRLIGTVRAIEDSTDRVGRYLLMQLVVNAGLGAVFGAGLLLMGVPYAPLWAVLMAIFRFIPFVGTWIAVLMPLSLSFATSPDWSQPLMILAYFAVLDLLTANVIEPLLFGHHTGVSPIALLTAAVFWAWVWGPMGLLLSTPLTVCLAVVGQHFAPVRALGQLLGDKRALAPPIDYYQRVLTDGGAAGEPVALEAAARGRVAACDEVLIPALALARNDRVAGSLTLKEELEVQVAVRSAVGPVMAVRETAPVTTAELNVAGLPAHVDSEEIPLAMLTGVVEHGGGRMAICTTRMLPGEMVRQVGACGATAVVISSLPPGGLPQTAFLCEQLREQYPDLLIIVSRWGGVEGYDDLLVELRRSGASYLTTSLQQTVTQLKASARRLQDASATGVANA